MKIKEVCAQTGLTDRTIRYYIECGLLHPEQKESYSGRKNITFTRTDVERLKSIKLLRQAGFSIDQIRACRDSSDVTPLVQERLRELEEEQQKRLELMNILKKADLHRDVSEEELLVILSSHLQKEEEPPSPPRPTIKLPLWAILVTVFAMIVVTAVEAIAFFDIELFDFQYLLAAGLVGLSIYMWIRKIDLPVCTVLIVLCASLILPTLIGNAVNRPSTLSEESFAILTRVPWDDNAYFTALDRWHPGDGEYEYYYLDLGRRQTANHQKIEYTELMVDVQKPHRYHSLVADKSEYVVYEDLRIYESHTMIYDSNFQAWLGIPSGVNRYYEILTENRAIIVHEWNYDSLDESYFEALLSDIDPKTNQ